MAGPSHLRAEPISELVGAVQWPDGAAGAAAREHCSGSSARVVALTEWLAATQGRWPPRAFARPRLLTLAPPAAGTTAVAERVGAGVRLLEPPQDPTDAFAAGADAADAEVEAGADVLVLADPGTAPAAAVVVGLLTGAEPVALLARGAAAVDTSAWVARAAQLRDARRTTAPLRAHPDQLLAAAASPGLAASAGVVVQAAARRTPVIVDGTSALAAALLCVDLQRHIARWLQVADTSADPVHVRAVTDLQLPPVLTLGSSCGDGTAGLLALGVLSSLAAHAGWSA